MLNPKGSDKSSSEVQGKRIGQIVRRGPTEYICTHRSDSPFPVEASSTSKNGTTFPFHVKTTTLFLFSLSNRKNSTRD
ncbi:hypothetical protein PtB15_15B384 [Puccinia triticina]|nr:hypothetical protein PtB15_15B384 [Puccinia triticina]